MVNVEHFGPAWRRDDREHEDICGSYSVMADTDETCGLDRWEGMDPVSGSLVWVTRQKQAKCPVFTSTDCSTDRDH